MAAGGLRNCAFIDKIMTTDIYIDLLRHNLRPSPVKPDMEELFIFQQDNDPKHTAWAMREWLLYNAIRLRLLSHRF